MYDMTCYAPAAKALGVLCKMLAAPGAAAAGLFLVRSDASIEAVKATRRHCESLIVHTVCLFLGRLCVFGWAASDTLNGGCGREVVKGNSDIHACKARITVRVGAHVDVPNFCVYGIKFDRPLCHIHLTAVQTS
jgi:hypothetical protein